MVITEQQLKKELSLRTIKGNFLFYGEEWEYINSYKKKIIGLLNEQGAEIFEYDFKTINMDELLGNLSQTSMFGGMRGFVIKGMEIGLLNGQSLTEICEILSCPTEETIILITVAGEFDVKKNATAKRIIAACNNDVTAAVEINKRDGKQLLDLVRAFCSKQGCDFTPNAANFLIEYCGDDTSILLTECQKLCAYLNYQGEITNKDIKEICSHHLAGDMYSISKMMLKGNVTPVINEIDSLIKMKQPVVMMIANLCTVFSQMLQASAAFAKGVNAQTAAKELGCRFPWQMSNAFRDASKVDSLRIEKVCELFQGAETTLKSQSVNERVLLETTIIKAMALLEGKFLD